MSNFQIVGKICSPISNHSIHGRIYELFSVINSKLQLVSQWSQHQIVFSNLFCCVAKFQVSSIFQLRSLTLCPTMVSLLNHRFLPMAPNEKLRYQVLGQADYSIVRVVAFQMFKDVVASTNQQVIQMIHFFDKEATATFNFLLFFRFIDLLNI